MIISFFYVPFLILQCFVKAYDNLERMPGLIEKNTGQDVRKKKTIINTLIIRF